MNRNQIIKLLVVLTIGFLAGVNFTKAFHTSVPVIVPAEDTLHFKVRELQNEIAGLKVKRTNLQHDTIRIYDKHNAMLSRINNERSDSAQQAILQELLDNPKPQLQEINKAIAEGVLCCDLLENIKEQLVIADSTSRLQDTIICTQQIEILNYKICQASGEVKLAKTISRLHHWRTAALGQALAITIAVVTYKLTH